MVGRLLKIPIFKFLKISSFFVVPKCKTSSFPHEFHPCCLQLENKITGRESQGAFRQDEMIGGNPLVVK
jgi:hypothetical protein